MNFLTENIIIDIANLGNIIVTPLRKVMKISEEELELEEIVSRLKSDYLLLSSVYIDGKEFDMNSQLIKTDNNESIFGKKINENIKNIPNASNQIASEILVNLGFKNNLEIAFEGKQKRFNEAYKSGEYQKAIDIVNPAKREKGLTVNIKGEFGFNRKEGTLTDDFYELFDEIILPRIKDQPHNISIDIHSSNEQLPTNTIFENNLDMTVAVAKNMESYVRKLNLEKEVYVYGVGDILPSAVDSIRAINPSWKMDMITREFIDNYNTTKKQRSRNNRITVSFLGKSF
jgi:flagellar motor protein MotB